MRSPTAAAFAALALVACGDNGHAAAVPDGPGSAAGSGDLTESGMVTDATTGYGLGSATVCIVDRDLCTTTSGDGAFAWEVPAALAAAPIATSVTAAGYLGVILPSATSNDLAIDDAIVALLPDPLAGATYGLDCGFALSGSAGLLVVHVASTGSGAAMQLGGATVALSPPGAGPVYAGSDGVYSTALTSTAPVGAVAFGELGSGSYDVTVTAPDGGACAVTDAWPPGSGAPGSTTRVPVAGGFVTTDVDVLCH